MEILTLVVLIYTQKAAPLLSAKISFFIAHFLLTDNKLPIPLIISQCADMFLLNEVMC